ncbi:YceD family protein [Microbacterium sp. STN6]|uniref:YceD family protein n=1 Tax=Microbacterium sp. STN6 TaxID=2995588 RepID=UPI002260E76E|nr:YceD family protein [Microbacterium sp. STN6]MCX7522100.1 YceD family protein [Microbacterium sp. STN6]
MHRPGEMREKQLSLPVTEPLGEGLVSVPAGEPIATDLRLESLHEGILASASLSTTATGECGRCLIDIELPVQVDFQEVFAYSSDEAFDYEVHDDHVDLEPLVRDAVVLSLPFQPVCRPDCPGLDPETGERLADHPEKESPEPVDPRWSALAGFQASEDDSVGHAAPAEREES